MVVTLTDASDFTYGNGRSLTNSSRRKPLCNDIFPVDLLYRNNWPLNAVKMEMYYRHFNKKNLYIYTIL